MRGNDNGTGAGNGSASGSEGPVSLIELKAEIARLKVLKGEAAEEDFELSLSRISKLFSIPKRKLRYWVDDGGRDGKRPDDDSEALAMSVDSANALVDGLVPDLVIDPGNLPAAVYAIRDAFVKTGALFERGIPVRVVACKRGGLPQIVPLAAENVILEAHKLFRPVMMQKRRLVRVTYPLPAARQYLALKGEWELPPLEGISTAPLLTNDGGIGTAEGYDPVSSLWCTKIPQVSVSERPSEADAKEALHTLRRAFRTFAFADAPRKLEKMSGANGQTLEVEVVDLEQNPARDESTLLVALLGAVCRPSLHLAPAIMVNAAQLSGSGSGKGLLLCGVSVIAFGVPPWRFTKGGSKGNPEELEKRVCAALLGAHPFLLLENVNNAVLQSETLESVLSDRPCRTRLFNTLEMVELYSTALIGMTGNALTPGRDLVRKVIVTSFDARTEVPALRKFPLATEAWLAHIKARRGELLSAALTIWRFGRQQEQTGCLAAGEAFGSYEQWCRWCRDPLMMLGCKDPVVQIHELREADPQRENLAEIYTTWWECHANKWVSPATRLPTGAEPLAAAVREIINADGKTSTPQALRTFLNKLHKNRSAGFVFERYNDPKHPTIPSTYRIQRTAPEGPVG